MAAVHEYVSERADSRNPVDATERILQENPDRYCMFPIHYNNMWQGFKRTETAFWTAEDIDFSRDQADWQSLNESERKPVGATLAYLLTTDALLLGNVALRFLVDVEQPEARAFYSFQAFKQNIHSEALSLAVTSLIEDEDEQAAIFRSMRSNPIMQRKVDWATRWLDSSAPFGERLVALAVVESIFYCSSFCSLFQLKKRGLLPGLSFAIDLISRDEGIDCEFHGIIYGELQHKLSQEQLQEIVQEAVAVEKEFAGAGALNVAALGLKVEDMEKYIEFVADQLAATLGHERLYKAANPFNWLEAIALKGKEEKAAAVTSKTANMSMAGVLKQVEARSFTLNFDEDF